MGILASGALPCGVQLSNVYISLNDESIYVKPNHMNNTIEYTACYKVFGNQMKQGPSVRVPFQVSVPVEEDTKRAYDVVYTHLKNVWPENIDIFDTPGSDVSETMVPTPTSPMSNAPPS